MIYLTTLTTLFCCTTIKMISLTTLTTLVYFTIITVMSLTTLTTPVYFTTPLDETHLDAVRGLIELRGLHPSASTSGARQSDAANRSASC